MLNFFLIRGLNKGIELFCHIAMPLLLVIAIVLVRVLTLPGMSGGLAMTWNPTVAPEYIAAGDRVADLPVPRRHRPLAEPYRSRR